MGSKHALFAAAFMLLMSPANGQEVGQPERGFELARQNCAECHAVGKDGARSPNQRAPTFQTIASVPGMTAIALAAALNTSHRTMPNIVLNREEQANIIAYILTLR
jgi:mono/diheme cytochrome c family protein